MTEPWPACDRCGHAGPHHIEQVWNIHLYRMDCGACLRYMRWLGKAGQDWFHKEQTETAVTL